MANGLKQDISIGPNLKRIRKKCKLTQKEAVAKLQIMGIEITTEILSKIEQGRYSIKISILLALKHIYGVASIDDFFVGLELDFDADI